MSLETDLGEYIQQLDNELYHYRCSRLHQPRISPSFHAKTEYGTRRFRPCRMIMPPRQIMREKYPEAKSGSAGAILLQGRVLRLPLKAKAMKVSGAR